MTTAQGTAVLVADDHDNEVVFSSFEECVSGLRRWFDDLLEASCQGLSEEGIEEMFPGLLGRLREAAVSIPVPEQPMSVDRIAEYASSLSAKVLSVCRTDDEREAVGVPTQFSLRRASPLEIPDQAALVELAKRGR